MIVDIRQMLLPIFLADVIAMVHDRCYCHGIKADVIASYMFVLWQMLLPCSVRQMLLPIFMWKMLNHMFFQLIATSVMADVIA